MASKRMFNLDVVDTDLFLDMPTSSQALYFHLGMRADDDGFVSAPKKIAKISGCTADDLRILISKGYAIPFESGIVVLTHWNVNNNRIKSDRYRPTIYEQEKAALQQQNGRYFRVGDKMEPSWNQLGDKAEPQNRIDKNRVDKININTYCASVPDDTKPEPEAAENTTSSAEKKKASAPNRKEANELFERLWSLYPSKKGKGQVSDRKKAELLKVGYKEMSRAIKRYKECLEKDADWRKPQNGSTFFNSGYIDYLDKNYTGAEDDGMDDSEQRREEMERYADLIPDFPEDADLPFG